MDLIETLDMKYDPYLELIFPRPWSMVGNQVSKAGGQSRAEDEWKTEKLNNEKLLTIFITLILKRKRFDIFLKPEY